MRKGLHRVCGGGRGLVQCHLHVKEIFLQLWKGIRDAELNCFPKGRSKRSFGILFLTEMHFVCCRRLVTL